MNQGQQFVDPELNQNQQIAASDINLLSDREKEVGAKLFIALTTAHNHMQSDMRGGSIVLLNVEALDSKGAITDALTSPGSAAAPSQQAQ